MAKPETETLDSIVDEILRGERIVPFPPGTLAFVFATLTLLVGSSLSFASTLPRLIVSHVPHPAATQLGAAIAVAVIVSIGASAVAMGVASGYRIMRNITHAFFVFAMMAAIFSLVGGTIGIHVLVLISQGISIWLVNGVSYRSFAHFKHRLHQRRAEMVEQKRTRD